VVHVLAWRDLDDVESGGSEVYVHEVVKRLAAVGLDVKVRTSHAAGRRPITQRDGYTVVRRAGRFWVFPSTVAEELSGHDGKGDALIEVWNGVPYFSPVWFRGPRVAILHHSHREIWPLVLATPSFATAGRFIETKIAPRIYRRTFIVTDSNSSRADLMLALGFRGDRVRVGEPGIDPRFSPGGERSATPLVVSVGRLVGTKSFDALVDVVHAVRQRGCDIDLVIVGEGYERDHLEAQQRRLGAESWLTLAGRIPDEEVVELYRRAWAVASMSASEGWGMALTEAAACGTPAVASRINGHVDAVRDGESGLLANGPAEMADHLERLVCDPILREKLSAGALTRAAELSWDRTTERVLEALLDSRA